MSHLAAETLSAFDHIAVNDDAAAEAGTDDDRDRCFPAVGPKNRKVSPKRAGVAIV